MLDVYLFCQNSYYIRNIGPSTVNTCTECIQWNGHVLRYFSLAAGVTQGGFYVTTVLPYAIFFSLTTMNVGSPVAICVILSQTIGTICCSIFLYADETLLLAPTICSLHGKHR